MSTRIQFREMQGDLRFFSLGDRLGSGKHQYMSLRDVIGIDGTYIRLMLRDQPGFGLDQEAMEYYIDMGHRYPDEKLPLTESKTIKIKNNSITIKPILGVNIMKKVILVSHDNNYIPGKDISYSDGGQEFSYLTNLVDLQPNDFVVVDCAKGLKVCRVTQTSGLQPNQINRAHAWVVSKIDMTEHEANIDKQARIQEISNQVEARRKQLEGMEILKMMAKGDPDMRKMLTELGELDSSLVPSSLLAKPEEN